MNVQKPSTSDGLQPGVGERGGSGLDGEAHLRAAGILGELGLADPGDRSASGEGHAFSFPASVSRTVPETCSPRPVVPRIDDLDVFGFDDRDMAGEAHHVAGVVRRAQPDGDLAQDGFGSGPVRDEASDQAVGRQDVHEDVAGPAFPRERGVVVDVLEVSRRERTGDDERCGDRDLLLGKLVADLHVARGLSVRITAPLPMPSMRRAVRAAAPRRRA